MQKHSLVIAGHRTSVSLEAIFWVALRDLASEKGVSIAALAAEIDSARGDANLSSALRVYVLRALLAKADGAFPSPQSPSKDGRPGERPMAGEGGA
jgi:predicted DNA-binding ribbon-helix-helix protein